MKIDGKYISNKILDDLKIEVDKLGERNIVPHLAIIIIGNDASSLAYVRQKELKAKSIGVKTTILKLNHQASESNLLKTIGQLNNDKHIHGIIVQQPLPQQINTQSITQTINPEKDVDGFNSESKFEMPIAAAALTVLKKIYAHTSQVHPQMQPQFLEWLRLKKVVIIGKGETGGKPIINALNKIGINPSIVDSKTQDPELITKNADIIISAVGKSNVVQPKMIKEGVVLIGIGQSRNDGEIIGDYDEEKIKKISSFYTPTPGGMGPIDVAFLLKNVVVAAE